MGVSEVTERRWSHGPAPAVMDKGEFTGASGVRVTTPLRVGQHIVCIDGWLPPPPIQTAGRGIPPNPQKLPPAPKGE